MPETGAAVPAEFSSKSTLEKPLILLTEDDIALLTREDCRRYLKEKGMRKPSWNKSQAIQQVIMLKRLLESTPDSDAGSRKRLMLSRPNDNYDTVLESIPRGTCGDAESSELPEATASFRRNDLDKMDSLGGTSGRFAAASCEPSQPRPTGSTNITAGQMTIFYCGKVNVYDDVPLEKAQAVMHIAASPLKSTQELQVNSTTEMPYLAHFSNTVGTAAKEFDSNFFVSPPIQRVKFNENSQVRGIDSSMHRAETPVEGSSRKASVQRYLEKRKDRFKSKRNEVLTSSASVEMYSNHPMCDQILIGSDKCSPSQIRRPSIPTGCSSIRFNKECLPVRFHEQQRFIGGLDRRN